MPRPSLGPGQPWAQSHSAGVTGQGADAGGHKPSAGAGGGCHTDLGGENSAELDEGQKGVRGPTVLSWGRGFRVGDRSHKPWALAGTQTSTWRQPGACTSRSRAGTSWGGGQKGDRAQRVFKASGHLEQVTPSLNATCDLKMPGRGRRRKHQVGQEGLAEKHLAPAPWPKSGAGGQAAAPELLDAVRSAVPEKQPRWVDSAACRGVLSLEGCRVKGGKEERAGLGTQWGLNLSGITWFVIWLTAKRASLVAQLVKKPPAMQETQVLSLGWEDPLEKGIATHSSILGLPWWLSW